ncbi:MAG: hypothetical protein DRR42_15650 [Gammaproteobacteria bacterium]|nr:MAG: hypothetical protein DRR42_15650 [Gammaproteobacteria bacterium]
MKYYIHGLLGVLLVACNCVQAEYVENEKEPGFFPSLEVDINHEDNVYRSEKNTLSDSYYQIKPLLGWKMLFRQHELALLYKGNYGRYSDIDAFDYDDYLLAANLGLDLSEKLKLDINGKYEQGHDQPGDPGTSLIARNEAEVWDDKSLQGRVVYGRRIANAQVAFSLTGIERRYDNNTFYSRDKDTLRAVAEFYLKLAPKTWFVSEFRYLEIDYIGNQLTSEDNKESNVFIGVEWEATAKTSGKVLVGYIKKKPDSAFFDTYTGFGMEADVIWRPKEYSTVTISGSRKPVDGSDNLTSFYVADKFSLRWQHGLTELVAFELGASIEDDEYQSFKRDEKYTRLGGQLIYSWKRTVKAGVRFNHIERDSNFFNSDYRTNIFGVFIKWTPLTPSRV